MVSASLSDDGLSYSEAQPIINSGRLLKCSHFKGPRDKGKIMFLELKYIMYQAFLSLTNHFLGLILPELVICAEEMQGSLL